MLKFLFASLLTGFLVFCFSQGQQDNPGPPNLKLYTVAESKFSQAESLNKASGNDTLLEQKTDNLYRQALAGFDSLLPQIQSPLYDSLRFLSLYRTGFIHYYFDSLAMAKADYLAAITLKTRLPRLPDSLLFLPLIYTGGIYDMQNQFDSALFYYKKAEVLNDQNKKPLAESQRLFNRLGAMLYQTGNYRQAENYFQKAIAVLGPLTAENKDLVANYKNNIASILVKLEEYDKARSVYESLLAYDEFTSEINHNLGIIHLRQQNPQKALSYFKKVQYGDSKLNIDLYYNFALAHSALKNTDSADSWIHRAIAENIRWNGHRKNTNQGLIYKYLGDEAAAKKQFAQAAALYQQSVIQFDNSFNNTAITANPDSFTAVFSYINFFSTLSAKADVLKNMYDASKDISLLQASLDAYRTAFKLTAYVERTYDSDEARLFLGKIKHTVHSKPIDISLQLYDLTHDAGFLEEAYLFDQRNKASVLSFNVKANELKKQPGEAGVLTEQESRIRSAITRLSLKAATITDSAGLQQLVSLIRDNEIELGKIQAAIQADPIWQKKNFSEQIPSVGELQKKLDPTTTLLSYHLSDNELLILLVSANEFEYHKIAVNKAFFTDIELLKTSLHNISTDERYDGTVAATNLYRQLILPVQPKLQQKKRLVLIPDDELNYLPFEALQDENKKYLVEKFSVQYQFSTALGGQLSLPLNPSSVLAFAPFASAGYTDSLGHTYTVLPASKEETSQLKGKLLADAAAVKSNFLQQANHYSIVHLATHASVNNEEPMRSFITFYPGSSDYKLYAQEIYDLDLDSLQLIILSACETGTGQLIKGEGLMSLTRAFTYAGCPNIITSLWKAEDKTTAFLTTRLHYYLGKKYTKDHALQQAKIDLLNNPDIDPRLKAPSFWAHLVFAGNYEADHTRKNWWWLAITIICGAAVYKLLGRKKALPKKQGPTN